MGSTAQPTGHGVSAAPRGRLTSTWGHSLGAGSLEEVEPQVGDEQVMPETLVPSQLPMVLSFGSGWAAIIFPSEAAFRIQGEGPAALTSQSQHRLEKTAPRGSGEPKNGAASGSQLHPP